MTPERKAQIMRELEPILGPPPVPKPKVVTRNDVGTIRDADVHISRLIPTPLVVRSGWWRYGGPSIRGSDGDDAS
jgi:hypothetical protein